MKFILLITSLLVFQQIAWGQTATATATANTTAEESNNQAPAVDLLFHGIVLDKDFFEYRLKTALQNGQVDSIELRTAIRDELYNRALVMEQAKSAGLTKNKSIKLLAQEAQENVYIDLIFQEYLKTRSITDDLLKAEYDHQLKELSPHGRLIEYHLATIIVSDEDLAKELLEKSKTTSFAELAYKYSIDSSAARNGDLGWINFYQLSPAIRDVLPLENRQQIAKTLIHIGKNWHIVKVFERREGKPATFSESKERLKPLIIQKFRQEYLEELREKRMQARNEK